MPVDRIPAGLKLIVPRYHGPDDPPQVPAGVVVFGHQYSSSENTPPFGPSDINQAKLPLSQFLAAWGTNGGVPAPPGPREAAPPTPPAGMTDDDRALLKEVRELLAEYKRQRQVTAEAPRKRPSARKAPAKRASAKKAVKTPAKPAKKSL